MKNGFTLIELLVVVLIIGILAAAALPAYNRAVEKTYSSEAFINLKALTDAANRYVLLNDAPTSNIGDLDAQINGVKTAPNKIETKNFAYDIRNLNAGFTGAFEIVAARNSSASNKNYYLYRHYNGYFTCKANNPESGYVCRGFCGASACVINKL